MAQILKDGKKDNRGGSRKSDKPKIVYETTFFKRCSKEEKKLLNEYWKKLKGCN